MEKKEKILQTTIKLFATQGFEITSTSQISKEADVATGTLFHHFSTKEELINTEYLYSQEKAVEDMKVRYISDVKESLRNASNVSMKWGFEN